MIQAPDEMLLTDGVVLVDRFTDADVDALWAGEDDSYVRRSRLPGPFTRRDIANQIRQWQDQWRLGGTGRALAVRETASRMLVGGCVLAVRPDDGEIAELSYWVFPPYRCRGYATRSVELACRYAFDALGVMRLELYIEPTNSASLRVATKAGFRQEGLLRQHDRHQGGRSDMVLVARLRTDSPESGHGAPCDLGSKPTHPVGDGSGRPPSADLGGRARTTSVATRCSRSGRVGPQRGRPAGAGLPVRCERSGLGPSGDDVPVLFGVPPIA